MDCPNCGCHMIVMQTMHPEPHVVKRRRKCLGCNDLFHTYELLKLEYEYLNTMSRKYKMLTAGQTEPPESQENPEEELVQ